MWKKIFNFKYYLNLKESNIKIHTVIFVVQLSNIKFYVINIILWPATFLGKSDIEHLYTTSLIMKT